MHGGCYSYSLMNSNTIEKLSMTQLQYIETIHSLCLRHEHAHTKDIADMLNVKMSSVVDALKGLVKLELIDYRVRQPVTLTTCGIEVANVLSSRHEVFADFFRNILGLDAQYSENIASNIKHVIDDKVRSRLSDFNSFLKEDSGGFYAKIINKFTDNKKQE